MQVRLTPIATVSNVRDKPVDDFWGDTVSEITLLDHIPTEALDNIEEFSHLEIIYYFDQADPDKIVFSGHPRGNPDYPKMGILGQRKKDRPCIDIARRYVNQRFWRRDCSPFSRALLCLARCTNYALRKHGYGHTHEQSFGGPVFGKRKIGRDDGEIVEILI